jgi:hypothetical protein
MKRIKPFITVAAVVALTASLITSAGFASADQSKAKGEEVLAVYHYDGKEYRSLAGEPGPVSPNAVTPNIDDAKAREESLRVEDRVELKKWLISNYEDKFGGLYTDDNNGDYVFHLLTSLLNSKQQ